MNIVRLVRALPAPLRRHRLVRALLWLSPGSAVQDVRFNGGARVIADISDPFPRAYMLAGLYDPEFFSITTPFLVRGGTFLDVGANMGFCAFGLIRALAGTASLDVHLLEANERLCALLRRSAAVHPGESITVVHGCVTDRAGVSRLRVVHEELGGSYISDEGSEEVANVVLDEYLESRGIARVPLMKMDIEGLEPQALAGAARSLESGQIAAAYVEVSTLNLARQGRTPEATLSSLRAAGFDLFFVKAQDLRRVPARARVALEVNGVSVPAAQLEAFPPDLQTDVLAVHPSAAAVRVRRDP